jgi:tRNA A37 N6-isopentenylltransferase MiaA
MMRIVIIGNSGGGKSVLARRLAQALQLPCVEIDAILWLPGCPAGSWRLLELTIASMLAWSLRLAGLSRA